MGGNFEDSDALYRYLNAAHNVPLPAGERRRILTPTQLDSVGKANHQEWQEIEKRTREIREDIKKKAVKPRGAGAYAPLEQFSSYCT